MKHLNLAVSTFILSTALIASARAEIDLGAYRSFISEPDGKALLEHYIVGVGRGYFWGTVYAKQTAGNGFLCIPEKLVLNDQTFTDLFNQELRNPSRKGGAPYQSGEYVEVVLLNAMTDTFPCR